MLIRELYENSKDTAVLSFGRLNPPTIGHLKLVEKIKSIPGDHFLFLSHTQNQKTDPLNFDTKLKFAESFFPEIKIGDSTVKTIIDALKKVESLGYKKVVYVAGSDRVPAFEELLTKYNGKEYFFESIKIINAGQRDPDAAGLEGMSASKLREAAKTNNFLEFSAGVPNILLAEKLYNSVRSGLGIISEQPAVEPDEPGYQHDLLTMPSNTLVIDTPGELDWYKIGQHFPTIGQQDPHEFGQSESDMIVTFANREEMLKFVSLANKLGLKIKNISGGPEHPEIHGEKPVSEESNSTDFLSAIKVFLPLAMKVLDINKLPKIKLQKHIAKQDQPSFGRFVNNEITIYLGIDNRHPIDILRTLAHELVHFKQLLDGKLDKDSGNTGSPDENEAHVKAGIIMRLFDKKYPEYFKSSDIDVSENFADGKVKGKSRPGRVKRAGASCKGSVSDLRQRASRYGGERGKMYHWCANMKSGKKK